MHLLGRTWSWVPFPKMILATFTLWLGCQHKLLVTLFRKVTHSLMDTSSFWDLRDPHTIFYYNKQASLSLQPSFSVSPGYFAWILCCLLQMCREEIGWPHLTQRANYESNNSANSVSISNTILSWKSKIGRSTTIGWEIHSSEPKERWEQVEAPSATGLKQSCITEALPDPWLC